MLVYTAFLSFKLIFVFVTRLTVVDAAEPLSRSTGKSTLSLSRRVDSGGIFTGRFVEKDRSRAKFLRNSGQSGESSASFNPGAVMIYTAEVGIGTPPTTHTILIDIGSSNMWIGASSTFTPTEGSQQTGANVTVDYGGGFFTGEEWIDTVTLASDLVVQGQSFGVSRNTSVTGFDGILGLGPIGLTGGTVTNQTTIPTVLDNLFDQGRIAEKLLGIYYVPVADGITNGTLTFGGYDDSVVTGEVEYVPITSVSPASNYWGIDQAIYYGETVIQPQTAGILDTGTSLIVIASDAFQRYKNATGATIDLHTGLLTITPRQYSTLKTLSFKIGHKSYDFSPNAQIWPRSLNAAIGGSPDSIYLLIGDLGAASSPGFSFINGYVFFERYYTVLDSTNGRIGFAPTPYTYATIN